MFVPGINGSIIANSNAPSGSRLKGAYKNSKNLTKRKMPNGGSMPITNVSSQGDLDYSVSKKKGNFTGNLQGSVNAPSMSSNYIQPKLSYDRNALSSYVTPSGFGAGLQGNKAYINYNQSKQGMDMYRSGAAGYNTDKVNVNANANFKNNMLENAGVAGSYNINPNLSVVGNYNVSQGESGLNPNYFAGFKFNKTFKDGGGTGNTGYVKYIPPSQRPMTGFSSSTPSTRDNTYAQNPAVMQAKVAQGQALLTPQRQAEMAAVQAKKAQQAAQAKTQQVANMKARISDSQKVQDLPIAEQFTPENIERSTQATGDKFRLFGPSSPLVTSGLFTADPDSVIDNYINPAKFVGDMATNLGQSINETAKTGDFTAVGKALATPVIAGATLGYLKAPLHSMQNQAVNYLTKGIHNASISAAMANPVLSQGIGAGAGLIGRGISRSAKTLSTAAEHDVMHTTTSPLAVAKYKKGGWTPIVPKPYMRTSPAGNSGYIDNTRVNSLNLANRKAAEAAEYARRVGSISQGIEKKTYPTTSVVKASAQPVKKPTVAPKKAYVPIDNERVYSDNTSVYTKPFIGNEKKGQFKADEDFRQANESAKGLVLDILPTPAASFARGALGIDNRSGNFTEDQKKALAYAIAKAEIAKRGTSEEGYTGSFGYDDYPDKRVGFNALHNIKKSDGKFDERVEAIKKTWPTLTTQTTLGRASFKKQDKDNYLVHDRYNFDEQAKNPQSIMEKGEVLGRKLGIETETNLAIPSKYVEEARQKIKLEGTAPVKSESKVATKAVVEKSTKESVQPKSRLKETYEQSKVTPKKTINKTQETSSKSSNDTKLTGERLKVQNYQKMLNEKYGANLETDGAWGPKTQAAYEKYAQ